MNSSELVQADNATNGTLEAFNDSARDADWERLDTLRVVMRYVGWTLGLPGNILSAIVWMRLRKKNSSGVYLAALAINDLACQLLDFTMYCIHETFLHKSWFYWIVVYLWFSSMTVEPLLVLAFCIERLLAICWPLRVSFK